MLTFDKPTYRQLLLLLWMELEIIAAYVVAFIFMYISVNDAILHRLDASFSYKNDTYSMIILNL